MLAGYLNYFTFADNRPDLAILYSILRDSLIRTIGLKLGIKFRSVVHRFGQNITLRIVRKDGLTVFLDFPSPSLVRNPRRFLGAKIFVDPLGKKDWKISTIDAMGQGCANCGSLHY